MYPSIKQITFWRKIPTQISRASCFVVMKTKVIQGKNTYCIAILQKDLFVSENPTTSRVSELWFSLDFGFRCLGCQRIHEHSVFWWVRCERFLSCVEKKDDWTMVYRGNPHSICSLIASRGHSWKKA